MTEIEREVMFVRIYSQIEKLKQDLYQNYKYKKGFYDGMVFIIAELDAYQYELNLLKLEEPIHTLSWKAIMSIFKRTFRNTNLRGNYIYEIEQVINHTLIDDRNLDWIGISEYKKWKAERGKSE